jgi:glycosyltransferase involved in cell wall biosynthesis
MTDSFQTLVSIIIPVYNSELFLVKCLNSVVQQTYQHLEIILINDGSTDNSPIIVEDYASRDSRIVTIHKENGGIGSAYKTAFKVMTGDYVLFVDSDDWLELNAVEELVILAKKNKADIVYFGSKAFNENGEVIQALNFNKTEGILLENNRILTRHFEEIRHPSLCRLFNKNLFQDIVVFEQNIGIDEMLVLLKFEENEE